MHRCRRAKSRARGSVTLWFLLTLTILLAIGALAVDIPRVYAVKGELQNAADAAALAGAGALVNNSTGGFDWTTGASTAQAAISLNKSDGIILSGNAVSAGYWDVASPSPTLLDPGKVQLPAPPGQMLEPAVQVTVSRDATHNGGLVRLLLGGLLGMPTAADSATAVAIITPTATAPGDKLFPMVMDQCLYNLYWDPTQNGPVLDPATNQPVEFDIGAGASNGSCDTQQWTSFDTGSNSTNTIKDMLLTGGINPQSIGDSIHVVPGTKTSLYNYVPSAGTTVIMPVSQHVATNSDEIITAFVAFQIDTPQVSKTVRGHFVSYQAPQPSQGSGVPGSGGSVYGSPRLAF
jgi:hypothetical protein